MKIPEFLHNVNSIMTLLASVRLTHYSTNITVGMCTA